MNQNLLTVEAFRNAITGNVTEMFKSLTYKTYSAGIRQRISVALLFWKYLRSISEQIETPKDHEQYRIFLVQAKDELGKDNTFIDIICMAEMLPVSVWRKFLWRENVDFMSYESFLRRLQPKQIEALTRAYNECMSGLIPKVRTRRFIDAVKAKLGLLTFDMLRSEPLDRPKRRLSKGAWAFSLLNMDFGFSLYPKGEANDYMITNKSFTRFLSIKNHINDFIVNQEDGIYWLLYQKARSNSVFRPNKKVELKTHICPGFWLTLLVHFVFWFVSPIGFFFSVRGLIATGSLGYILATVATSLTPLWLLGFFLLKTIALISHLFSKMKSKKRAKPTESKTAMSKGEKNGLIAAIISCAAAFVGALYVWTVSAFSVLGIGPFSAVMFLTALLYLLFSLLEQNESGDRLHDIVPLWVNIVTYVSLGNVVFQLIDLYIAKPVGRFFAFIGIAVYDFAKDQPLIFLWLAITFGLCVFLGRSLMYFTKDERKFVRRQKLINKMIGFYFILTLLLPMAQSYAIGVTLGDLYDGFVQPILFLVGGIIVTVFILSAFSNERTIDKRMRSDMFVDSLSNRFRTSQKDDFTLSKKVFLKNIWLMSLPEKEAVAYIDSIYFTINELFSFANYKRSAFAHVTSGISQQKFTNFIETFGRCSDIRRKFQYEDGRIYDVLVMFCTGLSFEDACKKELECRDAKEKSQAKQREYIEKIGNFFRRLFQPMVYVAEKTGQFFATLKDLWSLFNERCPYVSKSQELDD